MIHFRTRCWLLALAGLVVGSPVAAETTAPPNILFILTDDQGWPTLGCYGNELVPTPNLDRIADEGVRFTDAYVTPQCTPTRAALLTGQHTARNGMWHVIGWYGYPWARVAEPMFRVNLPRETFTFPKGLQRAGYVTGCFGKWHLNTNDDGNYIALDATAGRHYGFDYVAPSTPRKAFKEGGDRGVDYLTDETLKFIERNRDRPFFCYLSHHTIHGVVVAPEKLVQKYREKGHPDEGLHNATYLAALEHLDRSVGRLLRRLDEWKLAKRTVVVFLSDNGGVDYRYDHRPFQTPSDPPHKLEVNLREFDNAPLRGTKGSMYEGGIRVPCLVRWPSLAKAGTVCDTPVHVVDWAATLLEVAGAKPPSEEKHPLDGDSLVPLLKGEEDALADRAIHWHLPLYDIRWALTPCAVIRRGDYKLIEFFGDHFREDGTYVPEARLELYNLKADLGEQENLAQKMPDKAAALRQELRDWLAAMPTGVPKLNRHYDPRRALLETRAKPAFLKEKVGD